MSEQEQLAPSQWADRITGPVHHFGIICGIERAAKILREKAGAYYMSGRDALAQMSRGLAVDLEEAAREMREDDYQETLQARKKEAFVELEKIDDELDKLRNAARGLEETT